MIALCKGQWVLLVHIGQETRSGSALHKGSLGTVSAYRSRDQPGQGVHSSGVTRSRGSMLVHYGGQCVVKVSLSMNKYKCIPSKNVVKFSLSSLCL